MNAIITPAVQTGWLALDLKLTMEPAVTLTQDQFFELCQQNRDMRLERTAKGEIVIMPPAGGDSSFQNSSITYQIRAWFNQHRTGRVYDSSGGFILPNGATLSPDGAWITQEQFAPLTEKERKGFAPVAPCFIVELMSPSDRLKAAQAKMEEFRDNGVKLGWLIDPFKFQVHVYRPGQPVEVHDKPATLSGEPELPGFTMDFADVWNP